MEHSAVIRQVLGGWVDTDTGHWALGVRALSSGPVFVLCSVTPSINISLVFTINTNNNTIHSTVCLSANVGLEV